MSFSVDGQEEYERFGGHAQAIGMKVAVQRSGEASQRLGARRCSSCGIEDSLTRESDLRARDAG